MNYRHAYHAGGFADVIKHVVLSLVIVHLRQKPAAFRLLDTHAGAGLYDLTSPEAQKTGEAETGIHALIRTLAAATLAAPIQDLLRPYREAIAGFNPQGGLKTYPGSPALACALMRPVDRLIACETEPTAAAALARNLAADRRAKAIAIDGWTALAAYLPPKERRGAVLIDPPFEDSHEFPRLADALAAARRKWADGIYLAWYPLKNKDASDAFARRVARTGLPNILRAELTVAPHAAAERLAGTGLLIVNPPWRLDEQLRILLPALAEVLGSAQGASRIDWLTSQK
ncbi:MAG: 23S rRNA (adenine(2030)-N(6))-methyltransferase RlmJ [Variibacter sp.]